MPGRFRLPPRAALTCLALAGAAVPSAAGAQILERFTLRGEGAAGFLLTSFQRDVLRDNLVGVNGAARLSVFVYDAFALQASVGQWYFPNDTGSGGGLVTATGGVRFEPRLSAASRLQIDVNAGVGFTGPLTRFGADVGLGIEFFPVPAVGIGPVVRYQYLLRTSQDVGESPQMLSAGLSVSVRVPPARRTVAVQPLPPPDTDRDGVQDAADACPTVPAGAHPDPARPGCPVGDRDEDGVLDDADACVDTPAGSHPDARRPGCPVGDRDGDGVLDDADPCADTPAGETPDPNRAGCPDGDDDHDGVTNGRDQCPAEPAGLHPDPARAGCPQPDRDGDSVPDATDHCPDQPGAPSTDPNRNGCPAAVSIQGGFVRIRQTIQFETDSDHLRRASVRTLRGVADVLRATPEIRRVMIEGHTDDTGDAAHNQDLSERRAHAVLEWLSAHGVEAARLESRGFGATHPLVEGTGNDARAVNRRVDFRIVDPPMPEGEAPAPPVATPARATHSQHEHHEHAHRHHHGGH